MMSGEHLTAAELCKVIRRRMGEVPPNRYEQLIQDFPLTWALVTLHEMGYATPKGASKAALLGLLAATARDWGGDINSQEIG